MKIVCQRPDLGSSHFVEQSKQEWKRVKIAFYCVQTGKKEDISICSFFPFILYNKPWNVLRAAPSAEWSLCVYFITHYAILKWVSVYSLYGLLLMSHVYLLTRQANDETKKWTDHGTWNMDHSTIWIAIILSNNFKITFYFIFFFCFQIQNWSLDFIVCCAETQICINIFNKLVD